MSDDRPPDRVARPGRGWAPRLFYSRIDEPRARRAGDVVVAIASLLGLALLSLLALPQSRLETGLINLITALPSVLDGLWSLLIGLIGLMAVVMVIAAFARRRWRMLADINLAVALTVGIGLIVGRLVQGSWAMVWDPAPVGGSSWVPWLRLTVPTAAVLAAAPNLTSPARRLGWWLATLGALCAALLATAPPTLAASSLLIAVMAASLVHLVLGSARGRPDIATVLNDLAALGVEVENLGVAERQPAGVFILEAEDQDGRRLDVKVYGRDAYDTQRLRTLWRTVWYREPGAPTSAGRLQQVEHEAFLTLLAAQAGVLAQPVLTAGLAPNEDALLVLEEVGHPVADWDETAARRVWGMLRRLHAARITHGQVDSDHLISDDDVMGVIDFRGARVSPDPWHRRVDETQGLITSVLALGSGPALEVAIEELGRDEVAHLLPFLQADVLTNQQQHGLDEASIDVDELRDEAAHLLGIEPPELEQLRRVTWGSVLRTVLPVLAFIALANVFAGLDMESLADSISGASWWYVAAGLLLAQVPRLFQAASALGASPIPLPLSRLYLLQLAQSYIALTIPGGAARIALNLRFFQRQGLATGSALTVGALDSFAGFVGQIILLALVLVFSSMTLDLDLDSATTSGLVRMLGVIVLIALLLLVLVLSIPRLRQPVMNRVRLFWTEAVSALRGLASPRRLTLLLGGNVSNELLLAVTLGAFTLAQGESVGLPELLFINITVAIFAGIVPIPGGIGVVEGALIFGLARAGLPEESAFAAAIMYRFATFYLPPVWGFFAFRSLERNHHL